MKKPGLLRVACIISFLSVTTAVVSHAQTLTTLHNFDGTDGSSPQSGIVQGADGNFYGTTTYGGASQTCSNSTGCGTVFQITPAGTLTTLQSFSFSGIQGSAGPSGLIQGSDGKFYGTTSVGGTGTGCGGSYGCGTIYTIVPGGTPVTLYNFCSQTNCADGYDPGAGLVQGADGSFYGTTAENTQPNSCFSHCGTIFKITSAGTLTTLYTFTGTGPYGPGTGLVQGSDGNFYGTTSYGGNNLCGTGQPLYCGTIFKITPSGTFTLLYSFCAQTLCPDGFAPGGLVQGTDGNFYGTTAAGGGTENLYPYGSGTVFKITPAGLLTTLHTFCTQTGCPDGATPVGLVRGTDGNFYGITEKGGSSSTCNYIGGCGTVFRITPQGTLITLYSFDSASGYLPNGMVQGTNGSFYGTTAVGGTKNDGTVFSLSIGLGGTTASTISLGLSSSNVVVGSTVPVALMAQVAATAGSGTPTGVVAFYIGPNEVGSANLSGGVATYNYNPASLAVNTYSITAAYSGDSTFAASTSSAATLTVAPSTPPHTSTPSFSVPPGNYTSAQTVTISDTTTGATIYYTTDGTTPTTNSAVYSGPIAVNSSETIEAIAAASGYSQSLVGTAAYTINISQPTPVISSLSPAFTAAGGSAFTLTVTGSGFTTASTVYWGSTALTTQYGSATQLTAHITASEIASAGTTAITVQTPAPEQGSSSAMQFEVDSSTNSSIAPTFTATTATVTVGSAATYPVTLASSATNVSITCLNLPSGATCAYSPSAKTVTISTSSTTPKGTYQITVVFAETVPASTAIGAILPILLFPLLFFRKKRAARSISLTACLGLALLACAAVGLGCSSSSAPTNQTVTSSGAVMMQIQ